MSVATDRGYRLTAATTAEVEEWRRKHPRQAPPYRVTCRTCGVRYWLSGLGVGSHERSRKHREAR